MCLFFRSFLLPGWLLMYATGCAPHWTEQTEDGIRWIDNASGRDLAVSDTSSVAILTIDRLAFKDLNKNGTLDPYEDWRLPVADRAADLAKRMSIEEIAGLMLYSAHQRIPGGGFGQGGTYGGKSYEESGYDPDALTDQQKSFLAEDHLRHILVTSVASPEVAAKWNNRVQAFVEGIGLGIPVNNSSDPRHQAASDEAFVQGGGGDISSWPPAIGLAASFDPELVRQFGEIASVEYRAMGLTTALSPQVDLATDPRWYRYGGTFGPSPELSTVLARAYIDGFQSSSSQAMIENGWGYESVNAMVKHWPGGGTGEGGRDAHYGFGKYAVYPGNNLAVHLRPFLEGAFALDGGTGKAAAVMPYYTISYDQDPSGEQVGNAYSDYFIKQLLRQRFAYDGVVCTDWGVTRSEEGIDVFGRTPWGMEHMTEVDRHYRVILAGCDQFGGNNDRDPILKAYQLGVKEHGEAWMRNRFEESAIRLLTNIFRTGLFEIPYLHILHTERTVGKASYRQAGYEAQQKSIVLLKNKESLLPLDRNTTIYLPQRYVPESETFFGSVLPARWEHPIDTGILSSFFKISQHPHEATVAIVVIHQPDNGRTAGYQPLDTVAGGNGYFPITLQYEAYKAGFARAPSIAGDPRQGDVLDRSYLGKRVVAKNRSDLQLLRQTVRHMRGKPVLVILKTQNPVVVSEFERDINALMINFGVSDQPILDVLSGQFEPSGLLPMQMPASMETVEMQLEDVPFDMEPHIDEEGNIYDFGFGLNWAGRIDDARVQKYSGR